MKSRTGLTHNGEDDHCGGFGDSGLRTVGKPLSASAPGRSRTFGFLMRSQVLCPLSYRGGWGVPEEGVEPPTFCS